MSITLHAQARARLLAGADQLADAVRVTLGPRGRNVALHQKADRQGATYADRAGSGAPVLITNDGATIAEAIVLPDPLENMGAQLLRQAAAKANEVAGDGTTTATVLAQSLLHEVFRNEAAGADPMALRRGMEAAGAAAVHALRAAALSAETEQELTRVATVSCGDAALGAMVGHALHAVGAEGVVTVEDSQTQQTTLEVQEGIVLERGFLAPEMATNEDKTMAELHDPYILLCDTKFDNVQELLPALIAAAEDGRDILVICEGLEGDARSSVLQTNLQGDIKIVCIDAPLYGDGRRWRMEDLAIQLGGVFFRKALYMDLQAVTAQQLGTARRVAVTRQRTVLSGPGGDPAQIEARVRELRYLAAHEDYEFNRQRHETRLAQLSSGVAVIRVGGRTQAELWERKARLEDAVHAAQAARRGGIVPGGGTALLRLIPAVLERAETLCGDERTGALSVARALEAPLRQLAENAGLDGSAIAAQVKVLSGSMGYDVERETVCDLVEAGILDPLPVTQTALESALSASSSLLTTQAGITGKEVAS